jgi:hypothetical protein
MPLRFSQKESAAMRFPFFFLLLLALLFSSCTHEQQDTRVVARVDDQVLTMDAIRSQVDSTRILLPADLQQIVNRWITSELLYQEARQRGYDASDEIQRKVAEARKQLSIASLLEKEVYSLAESSVQQNEIAKYFQEHQADYILKEDLARLSLAIFHAQDAANQFRAAALSSSGWDESVAQFRNDEIRGLLSVTDSVFYTPSSLYPPELWKVASALGMEEVSFPIKTSVGYIVIRSLGKFKKGTLTPLMAVEEDIRRRLAMERRQELYQNFIQQLRNKHTVQFMISAADSADIGGE